MMNARDFAEDLLPFVDIGSQAPKVAQKGSVLTAKFQKDGREIKVDVDLNSWKVTFQKKGFPSRGFASVGAMFASEEFANLRKWADSQYEFLRSVAIEAKKLIPLSGVTSEGVSVGGVSDVDALIGVQPKIQDAAEVLLIDGPAGIGKTNLVEQLALVRAEKYRASQTALILHVRSRGRVLSNLQDLMAFSLQTLRLNTTYDQIPVLLKYGLVIVAVDGFDELGDPNGYELAWTQVNDLISAARGGGTVLLSGRDTFLGRDRLFRDVQSLRPDIDVVIGLTLKSPTSVQAKIWLRSNGWADVHFKIPAISSLLEDDSFALRPVFLRLMQQHLEPKKLREESENFLTPLLVQHLIQREAGLFGDAVEAVFPRGAIENFILRFLIEIARDMADGQTEALDDTTISWLVDVSLDDSIPEEIVRLIRNRASVIAALKPDVRSGYKSFVHSHLQNYFLALATLDSIGRGEVPKFVKRNVLGSELLAVFGDVSAKAASAQSSQLGAFLDRAVSLASSYAGIDRASRNLGALLLSIVSVIQDKTELNDFEVDEAIIRGTASNVKLKNVSVHQLDCREADLSRLEFQDCSINSLIVDDATRFSSSIPVPRQLLRSDNSVVSFVDDVEEWMARHGRNSEAIVATGLASPKLVSHGIYKLLGRACRVRQYWLRLGDDLQADKILRDPWWGELSGILRKAGLLREESRQASGSKSIFFHIRRREEVLAENSLNPEVVDLFNELNAFVE